MKKIIAVITEEDKVTGISLISLRETYKTLLNIDKYTLDKQELSKKLFQSEQDIQKYWNYITEKYSIPLYLGQQMSIDNENNYIYIKSK